MNLQQLLVTILMAHNDFRFFFYKTLHTALFLLYV